MIDGKTLIASGILFDLDGVLVDSSRCVAKAWHEWASVNGIDSDSTFALGHGRTTLDHIRVAAPEFATTRNAAAIDRLEEKYVDEVTAQPGVKDAIAALTQQKVSWGIVTSCDRITALARMKVAGIPTSSTLVTADDVKHGKPSPDGYILGCRKVEADPIQVVVFEDAPSGILAARRAGIRVVALQTTHHKQELLDADHIVPDLKHVRFSGTNGVAAIEIDEFSLEENHVPTE